PDEDTPTPRGNAKTAAKASRKGGEDGEDEGGDEKKPSKKKKKKSDQGSKKLVLGLALAGVGVGVLVLAYFLIFNKKTPTPAPSPQPIARGPGDKDEDPDAKQPGDAANPDDKGDGKGANPADKKGEKGPAKAVQVAPGSGAGPELTNLLPRGTQSVFDVRFKDFVESPMGVAAFQSPGAFNDEELRRRLGFSVKALDNVLHAESFSDRWTFTVFHTLEPIDDLTPLKKAMALEPAAEKAIKNQDFYKITKHAHWLQGLARLSLGAPASVRHAQPADNTAPLYLRLHDRQTLIVAHLAPMKEFL